MAKKYKYKVYVSNMLFTKFDDKLDAIRFYKKMKRKYPKSKIRLKICK